MRTLLIHSEGKPGVSKHPIVISEIISDKAVGSFNHRSKHAICRKLNHDLLIPRDFECNVPKH